MKKKKSEWDMWYHRDHIDLDKFSKQIVGESLGTHWGSETTNKVNLENTHNYIF